MIENPRILAAVRLSVLRDETTSPERQRDVISHWANGPSVMGRIVGWAEDLDVSGGIHPMKRAKLGPWLTSRAHEFDVIACQKLDRFTRKTRHFAEMVDWCKDNGKILVFISEGIDMSTPMGRMFGNMIAAFAEGELDTIAARAQAAVITRKDKGVWIGGVEPFGYTLTPLPGGGKGLCRDNTYAPLGREVINRLFEDWSPYRVAQDLNRRGVLTWRDHIRATHPTNPKPPKGIKWTAQAVIAIVTNPTIAGYYTYKGQLVEDDEGSPIMITQKALESPSDPGDKGTAIATPLEWTRLTQRFTTDRDKTKAVPSKSELAGVGRCGGCQTSMTLSRDERGEPGAYSYYVCGHAKTGSCDYKTRIRQALLEEVVSDAIMNVIGHLPVYSKAERPGASARADLSAAQRRMETLEADYLSGRYDGEGQEESYWKMHKAIAGKITRLRREVEEFDRGPQFIPTGRTYAQEWAGKDSDQRRIFLRTHNVRAHAFRGAVDWSDETIIVEFGDLAEMARVAGVDLGGVDTYRYDYQAPVGASGAPLAAAEVAAIVKARRAMEAHPANAEEKEIVKARRAMELERARGRRLAGAAAN